MKSKPLVLALIGASLAGSAMGADDVRGYAAVKSGNEILIGKRIVRLFGVLAPGIEEICQIDEAKMKCGIVAWAELIRLADGWHVSCDVELKTKDGAEYATCYIGERDVNEGMVRSGWARAARKQTDRYIVDEEDARASKRGLWSGGNAGG